MNVAIYARVSTHDNDQNPETQLRPLRQHLAGLTGVSVLGEFIDKAGADDLRGRREWRRLLNLALSGKADLIVVWKLDRAFRSVVDGANTLQSLRSGGCGIRSLQEPWIDTTTPIGEAMYHITIAWAQLEKRQLTERVKAGMERARAEGKSLGRPQRSRPLMRSRPRGSVPVLTWAAASMPLPAGAAVLRPERWWWALHQHRYVSARSMWFQRVSIAANGQQPAVFARRGTAAGLDSVIVNNDVRDDIRDFPAALQTQFRQFIEQCTILAADVDDPTYLDA